MIDQLSPSEQLQSSSTNSMRACRPVYLVQNPLLLWSRCTPPPPLSPPLRQRSSSPSPASSPLPPTKGLPSDYQAFIHTSRYARWVEKKQRRETWPETIERCVLCVMVMAVADVCVCGLQLRWSL